MVCYLAETVLFSKLKGLLVLSWTYNEYRECRIMYLFWNEKTENKFYNYLLIRNEFTWRSFPVDLLIAINLLHMFPVYFEERKRIV